MVIAPHRLCWCKCLIMKKQKRFLCDECWQRVRFRTNGRSGCGSLRHTHWDSMGNIFPPITHTHSWPEGVSLHLNIQRILCFDKIKVETQRKAVAWVELLNFSNSSFPSCISATAWESEASCLKLMLRPRAGRCAGSSGGYQDTFRATSRSPWARHRTLKCPAVSWQIVRSGPCFSPHAYLS